MKRWNIYAKSKHKAKNLHKHGFLPTRALPISGYTSLMVRKELAEEIESLVDESYHGHTVATAINTMQSDLKEGKIKVTLHDIPFPSGAPRRGKRFASFSVRDDIMQWFEQERRRHHDEYLAKYGKPAATRLGPFATRFLVNILLSKKEQENFSLKLKPDDYDFLRGEFEKLKGKYGVDTFDQFLPLFIRDLVRKANNKKE